MSKRFQKKRESGIKVKAHYGPQFEKNVLGNGSKGRPDIQRIKEEQFGGKEPTLSECIELARKKQPKGWNPYMPSNDIASTFFVWVRRYLAKLMKIKCCELRLMFYSAVDSAADYLFGVDFFVYLDSNSVGRQGIGPFVTVDLSLRNKAHIKADLLLSKRHIESRGGIQMVAEKAAARLYAQI
ncbi:MAG: hypothetical protein WCO30_01275 [bacterium]